MTDKKESEGKTMKQTYTSSATSINSTKLPAVYRRAKLSAPFVLDYGCGKYTDHIKAELNKQGRHLFPYDPYNQPEQTNKKTMESLRIACDHELPMDVICSNVLNVIDDDKTVLFIAETIENIVTKTGGTAYITVYEGNRSGVGRQTGKDQYQRNEPLRNYLRFFRNVTVKNEMIVVER